MQCPRAPEHQANSPAFKFYSSKLCGKTYAIYKILTLLIITVTLQQSIKNVQAAFAVLVITSHLGPSFHSFLVVYQTHFLNIWAVTVFKLSRQGGVQYLYYPRQINDNDAAKENWQRVLKKSCNEATCLEMRKQKKPQILKGA